MSSKLIASSITSPMAAAMPPSVIRLKFMPQSFITTIVTRTVTGITIVATNGTSLHAKTVDLAVHVNNWVTQIIAGESANDPVSPVCE